MSVRSWRLVISQGLGLEPSNRFLPRGSLAWTLASGGRVCRCSAKHPSGVSLLAECIAPRISDWLEPRLPVGSPGWRLLRRFIVCPFQDSRRPQVSIAGPVRCRHYFPRAYGLMSREGTVAGFLMFVSMSAEAGEAVGSNTDLGLLRALCLYRFLESLDTKGCS